MLTAPAAEPALAGGARRLLIGGSALGAATIYGRAARRGWWIVLAAVAAGTASALFFTSREVPRYAATATTAVVPAAAVEGTADLLRSLETLERRTVVATVARLASTREARNAAAARAGVEPADLRRYRFTASVVPSTNLIRLRVEGPDPAQATALANAAGAVTEEATRRMYRVYGLEAVEAAVVPGRPVHPDPQRNVLVAAILGLFLGIVVAVALEFARGRGVPAVAR